MPTIFAILLKSCLTTFLTEKVVMCLVLKIAQKLAKRTTNTLDDDAVAILQKAYDSKLASKLKKK